MNKLDQFDFAAMILSPDDMIESRGQSYASPRDNVLFELGLFMGRLGRSRVFIVHEQDANLKLPSDLAGITLAPFLRRGDGSPVLGPTCTLIRKQIKALGFWEKRAQLQIQRLESEQERLSQVLWLTSQVALKGIVTKFELDKLRGLADEGPFRVHYHPRMYDELRHLDAMRFISPAGSHGLGDIKINYSNREHIEFDLKEYFGITDEGRKYLSLLEELSQLSPSDQKRT